MAGFKGRASCEECYFGGHDVLVEASFSPGIPTKEVQCPKCGTPVKVWSPEPSEVEHILEGGLGRNPRQVGDHRWWTQYLGLDVKDYKVLDKSPEFKQRLRALKREHKDRLLQSIGTVTYYYRTLIGRPAEFVYNLRELDDARRRFVRVEVALAKGLITNPQGNGVLEGIRKEFDSLNA